MVERKIHNYSWEFNNPLTASDKITGQKISKDITNLNHIINQQDVINIYIYIYRTQY